MSEVIDRTMFFLELQLEVAADRAVAKMDRAISLSEAYLASLPSRDDPNDYRPSDCEAQST